MTRFHQRFADRSMTLLIALAILSIALAALVAYGQAGPSALALFASPASPVPAVEQQPTVDIEATSVEQAEPEPDTGFPLWAIAVAAVVVIAVVVVVLLTRRK